MVAPQIQLTTDPLSADSPWEQPARDAVEHACYQIANAPLRLYPTPHIYVSHIFPPAFYAKLVEYFPTPNRFRAMQNSDHGNDEISDRRYFLSYFDGDNKHLPDDHASFWDALLRALSSARFEAVAAAKFGPYIDILRRTLLGSHQDILLISDRSGYDISPHTDTPQKQFSLLFYCPENDSHPHIGTSLFRRKGSAPRQPKRTDSWFYHGDYSMYPFAEFEKVFTAPYLPNSLFGFVRTRYSYHGVEPTSATIARQLLIYENFSLSRSRKLRAQRQN